MTWLEVLVEGASDAPTIKEILQRKFGLLENTHFRIHSHRGKGKLPANPLSQANPKHQGLLDQLPAKLRGFGKSLVDGLVLVVLDADDTPAEQLLSDLAHMLTQLPCKPRVLFCLAVEETESWFIADIAALERAFPKRVKKKLLRDIKPDSIVGAWEKLACALSINPKNVSGLTKYEWAMSIAPYLDFDTPISPSLGQLIKNIAQVPEVMAEATAEENSRATNQ